MAGCAFKIDCLVLDINKGEIFKSELVEVLRRKERTSKFDDWLVASSLEEFTGLTIKMVHTLQNGFHDQT